MNNSISKLVINNLKRIKQIQRKFLILLFFLSFALFISAKNHQFTIVIDAGHGGHDPGAIGKITKEKHINLAVALTLGKKIKKNHKDVKVLYTRTKDVFIPLHKRADVANRNHADLFISIHTNAASSRKTRGTETYILGHHKTKTNLNVAMRENSVITLESNYKKRYKNFNPYSVDSYIMFSLMQDRYINNSIYLASQIQKEFSKVKRRNLGVKQAGFVVLYRSACPSILVELGFITNRSEEHFLNSKSGKKQLANAIYKAFVKYKKQYDKKSRSAIIKKSSPKNKSSKKTIKGCKKQKKTVYKIQLFAVKRKLPSNSKAFKGLKNVDFYKKGSYYQYTYGSTTNYQEIKRLKKKIIKKFPHSIIIGSKK